MAEIINQCPRCCGTLRINIGQSIYNGEVNYYEEHFCIECGYALEIDCCETPFNSRKLLLEEQGTWEIVCLEKNNELLKIIRKVFNYSIKQLAELKSQGTISFVGTLAEINNLKNIFESHNFHIEIKRIV